MRKILKYMRPYAKPIVLSLVLLFSQAVTELFLPKLMAEVVDGGIATGNIPYIIKMGGIMIAVAIVSMACAVGNNFLTSRAGMAVGRDMRNAIFSHVESLAQPDVDKVGTPSLITRTTNDVMQIQNLVMMGLRMICFAPIMLLGGIVMAVTTNRKLSVMLLAIIPILILIIAIVMKKSTWLFTVTQEKLDNVNKVMREKLTGVRVIRAFDRVQTEEQRFDQASIALRDVQIRVGNIMAILMPIMTVLLNLSTVAVLYFGSIEVNTGDIEVGALMAFIQYATTILFSLVMASMMFMMLPRAQASARRFNEVMELQPSVLPPEAPKTVDQVRGVVSFEHVTFSYPGAEQPVLSDVHFTTRPGEITAVIGGTGYGKSTLVNLIPRFYDVSSGCVKIDGVDVRQWDEHLLHTIIGYVPQKAFLFGGTVAQNMRYANEDATDQEIWRALEIAQAKDFVTAMEGGLDAVIAQNATNVSGGQKQRLSIARAIVRNPKIYIFDDSFSALDFKTDARLRAALAPEIQNASVLIVAQRVSTIMHADRIIVLDDGCVAGIGTHRELMDSCPVYKEIVSSQLSEEEIA